MCRFQGVGRQILPPQRWDHLPGIPGSPASASRPDEGKWKWRRLRRLNRLRAEVVGASFLQKGSRRGLVSLVDEGLVHGETM